MKLKYYLRGLGIGVFISTIILSISFSGRSKTLTNVEIMDKAKELGMMDEKDVELELSKKIAKLEEEFQAEEESQVEESKEDTDAEGSEEIPEAEQSKIENTEEIQGEELEDTKPEENSEETNRSESESITFTIESGMWSEEVSRILENNGLVTNAREFNTYLIQNGYQSKIRTGEYNISKGATFEEVAKTITSR